RRLALVGVLVVLQRRPRLGGRLPLALAAAGRPPARRGEDRQLRPRRGDALRVRRGRHAAAAAARRGAGADVDALGRPPQRADLRLRRLVEHEALALGVNARNQAVLVAAGVDGAVGADRHAQDVLLLGAVEDAGLAVGRDAEDAPLGAGAG